MLSEGGHKRALCTMCIGVGRGIAIASMPPSNDHIQARGQAGPIIRRQIRDVLATLKSAGQSILVVDKV